MYSSAQLDEALYGPPTQETLELPRHVVMAGLIGAGKTTLADNLGRQLGCLVGHDRVAVHHESVDTNEILPLFYQDMSKWGFPLQCHLLTQRHRQQQRIAWSDKMYHIEDRFMDEDHVFATTLWKQGHMDKKELSIYRDMVQTYERHVKRPDLIVFLDVSAETSLQRIRKRGRKMEANIPVEYLQALEVEYKEFIREISKKIPVIRVTWEEFQDTSKVAELIMDRWKNKCFNISE